MTWAAALLIAGWWAGLVFVWCLCVAAARGDRLAAQARDDEWRPVSWPQPRRRPASDDHVDETVVERAVDEPGPGYDVGVGRG